MALKIVVCVKPVPANTNVTIDPVTKTVRREAGENVISTLDKNALELAAQLKRTVDCEVTVISMAPASAEINIREALARGGDKAVILSDRAFAGGDTYATSYVLSQGIKKLGGCDLVLMGSASDDGGTGQLTAQLGEWLGMRHLHNALRLELKENHLEVTTAADKQLCTWKCDMPAVVSVNRSINKPGPAPVRNIIMAARKPLQIWSADDLDELDRNMIGLKNSPTQNGELYPLDAGRSGVVFEGSTEEIVEDILDKIASAGIQL